MCLLLTRFGCGCLSKVVGRGPDHEELRIGVVDEFRLQGYPSIVCELLADAAMKQLVSMPSWYDDPLTFQDTRGLWEAVRRTGQDTWGSSTGESNCLGYEGQSRLELSPIRAE